MEKDHLRPLKLVQTHEPGKGCEKSYKVRKDNTIAYRGNFYTVPTARAGGHFGSSRIAIQPYLVGHRVDHGTIVASPICI